jgi:urea carboxylase
MQPPTTEAPAAVALPFHTVLVANRGEIAVRLVRGVQRLGLRAAAVYTPVDATAAHVARADVAVPLAEGGYNDPAALVRAALLVGAGAVLPGYGFVSENADAAHAFEDAGVRWVGPTPDVIDLFGLKHTARRAAIAASVPTVPGSPLLTSVEDALEHADRIGFPALVKASAGGGGMGQAIVFSRDALPRAYESAITQGESLFKNAQVYMERYISHARHIEVQVFGNGKGDVMALGERDCSVQRRRQKVLEEGPAPDLDPLIRQQVRKAAEKLCAEHNYRSAGTVEFILDADTQEWYFLEVNTRLQVEHGVTELVSGVDIVEMMLLLAGGIVDVLDTLKPTFQERGCSIEARVYAENPVKNFDPCPGILSQMTWPDSGTDIDTGSIVRVDSWAERGTTVSANFDPLLGKVLVWGRTRTMAIEALVTALRSTVVRGVATNVELLLQIAKNPDFVAGKYTTSLLDTMQILSTTVEVITPGMQSSLQDYPGRVGFWNIGVSPSGPMDAYAMGMANALVGNSGDACALEMTVNGPTLKFHAPAIIALTGGHIRTELDDGMQIPWWTPVQVDVGSVLIIGEFSDYHFLDEESPQNGPSSATSGKCSYLAVRGGFDAPKYLGSASTFPTGRFGGITGDFLKAGDFLPLAFDLRTAPPSEKKLSLWPGWKIGGTLPKWLIPEYNSRSWLVGALNGPHGSDDFLESESLTSFWKDPYTVHHAANRLGVRLIGPTPKWSRKDGGSAGLHPSNLHDYTYAPGAVNLSGNTPIVLMLDGPSLGGFVCPLTVASCELWKVAQAAPGSTILFKQISYDDARQSSRFMLAAWDAVRICDADALSELKCLWHPEWVRDALSVDRRAIVGQLDPLAGDAVEFKVIYRVSGDEHILLEYGDIELNIAYRMRVHMLMEELRKLDYVKELCPGVRSLLVRYNADVKHINELVAEMMDLEKGRLGPIESVVVPSRLIHLPLAFADKWTIEAQSRYERSIRSEAPYLPSNVEFVRRINGLSSIQDVQNIMSSAEYCVMGLGDVYLGAPCAVPIDPRHRLVTSKYNPARTYTPEGAVGIGGAYMCIYGMESPGGYQLCGRTLPIWDSHGLISQLNRGSPPEKPWLLQFFDRVKFFVVSDDELETLRARYLRGDYKIDIRDDTFSYKEHVQFCSENRQSIEEFEEKRMAAFKVERSLWDKSGEAENNDAMDRSQEATKSKSFTERHGAGNLSQNHFEHEPENTLPSDCSSIPVMAGVSATVWAVEVAEGDVVDRGQVLFVLESMKVEISIESQVAGTIGHIQVSPGDTVGLESQLCVVFSSFNDALKNLSIEKLRSFYRMGLLDPRKVISAVLRKASSTHGVMIATSSPDDCERRIKELSKIRKTDFLPLYGVPFVVSDNFDVCGMKTTAGCIGYQKSPKVSCAVVNLLEKAGAILVGKTNLDQFGASLTGTESSFGVPKNPSSPSLAPGGNAGASVSVSTGLASFAVTTDTCGTSIVPPALSGIFGLKATEGLISLRGIVPSCPSMDCISIMATTANDILSVLKVCTNTLSSEDLTLRNRPNAAVPFLSRIPKLKTFSLGVPGGSSLAFVGGIDAQAEKSYYAAAQRLGRLGGTPVEVDFAPFYSASKTFDDIPLDAARLGAFESLGQGSDIENSLRPAVAESIFRSRGFSAVELSKGIESLNLSRRIAATRVWSRVDVILFPSHARQICLNDVRDNPKDAESSMGRFSRFITAMDLCSITIGTNQAVGDGTPRGFILVAPAFQESVLLDIAAKW